MELIETQARFDEIIQSADPVIIKFFAGWCPDCRRFDMFSGQVMEAFSNYSWYEVNIDEIEGIAQKYEVMGIPSVLIFQNGEKLAHQHSAYTKTPEEVTEFLEQQLG
ncbi:thioredoxin family protein [Oceanobacillus alkalisoli]|uniref:thioredoxin family protein n=1 Tax=Oceanobacillus alkalisoli TaxID=2925113 RepID=UPI001EF0E239|nr:thioredoxin family protein [Oceanobacillus alkalisoli]MCF3944627.1 thioredoxin family protein [Oceanobacillus alkalisoli]MCG5104813.1 thioredoxin family protein [Oceanobacillus alkalisoli]